MKTKSSTDPNGNRAIALTTAITSQIPYEAPEQEHHGRIVAAMAIELRK